ncbi:unnamed protein product [Urochloa decumbens]|uniref:F-box domain-containing protein n=1 Tax=Urochloa decumbens TaxID=240449 RepID=A0ABC9BZA7_9POAL
MVLALEPPPWCSLPLDLILEIVSRCTTATVIRCAATCKFLRRSLAADPAFLRDDRFDTSLLAGHFHFEKKRPKLFDPFFVASNSNHPDVPPARIRSFLSDLSRKTFPNYSYKPLASRGGLLVLHRIDRSDPYNTPDGEILVWNPTRRFDCGLLRAAGIAGDSYILFPCDDSVVRSFRLIAVRFVDNLVETQAITCPYAALRERPPLLEWRLWGDIAQAEIAGPKAKFARHSLPPVLLRGVAYWLCKDSGTYRVLSLHVDTMEASYVAALPPECSSTAVLSRKEILVVPASPEMRLGLLTLGGEVLTLWALADDGGCWTRRATVTRERIACSAGVSSRPWPFQWKPISMELECCDERSGTVWLRIPGRLKAVVLSLQTMEMEVRLIDSKDPSIVCPYETMDFATCIATMKQF